MTGRRPTSRALLGLLLAASLLGAPSVAAADTAPISGQFRGLVAENLPHPQGGTHCEAYSFLSWPALPGMESVTVVWKRRSDHIPTPPAPATYVYPFDDGGYTSPGARTPRSEHRHATGATSSFDIEECREFARSEVADLELRRISATFCEPRGTRVAGAPAARAGCRDQVVGTVTDIDGKPIGGVPIQISGEGTVKTTRFGGFAAGVSAGRHTVTAPKGYCLRGGSGCDRSKSVQVNGTAVVNFVRSTADFTIEGVVTDEFGRKLGGVRVRASGPDSSTDITGDDGEYALQVDKEGTYTVSATGSKRGPYEIYYLRGLDGSPTNLTSAQIPLSRSRQKQQANWALDKRLQFKVVAPRVVANGASKYPLKVRVRTQHGDPAPNVEMTIDPAANGRPLSVICGGGDPGKALWPSLNADGTHSPGGLPFGPATTTDAEGEVSLTLYPGTEAGTFVLSGNRRGDASSTFYETFPFEADSAPFSRELVRSGLQAIGPNGQTFFGNDVASAEANIIDAVASVRRGDSDSNSADDDRGNALVGAEVVPIATAGGRRGIVFYEAGTVLPHTAQGFIGAANDAYVLDSSLLTRIQPFPNPLPTLAEFAQGQAIVALRADRRTFLGYPLPTTLGLAGCLRGGAGDTITYSLHSPAHMLLIDGKGRRIGFNAKGKEVSGAPGAAFRLGGDDRIVVPAGRYTVKLAGTGKGRATLEVRNTQRVEIATFRSRKGDKATFRASAGKLLPKRFRFGGRAVRSAGGIPVTVRGLPRRLRAEKKAKLALRVRDAFGAPIPFPTLRITGSGGKVAYGNAKGIIRTSFRPRRAGKVRVTVTGVGVRALKRRIRVVGARRR